MNKHSLTLNYPEAQNVSLVMLIITFVQSNLIKKKKILRGIHKLAKCTCLPLLTYNQLEGNNDQIKWKQEQDCAYAQKQNNIKINFQREKLILS